MISAKAAKSALRVPADKYESICRFVWRDESLIHAESLTSKQAALLVCGTLVYKYSRPDVALMLLIEIDKLITVDDGPMVISVVDEVYLSFSGCCWDITNGKSYEEMPDIRAVESHAIDVLLALSSLKALSQE